jgi:uncharacterized protein with NRDE domain
MCLLVFAWMQHSRYRLVAAANRDEFHDRPAAPLAWWPDDSRVLAGRDLRAGGTWLGATRDGRFGVLTNFRDLEPPPAPDAPSRGRLVPDYLGSSEKPASFLAQLDGSAAGYAGFNLLVGDARELGYLSNREELGPRSLAPGVYGLSNHRLDTPWPKLVRSKERLAAELGMGEPRIDGLFAILDEREPATGEALPATGLPAELERAMSSPFVLHERYGTRCSTVLLVGHDGRTVVCERRFDAAGRLTGATRLEFDAEAAAA